MQLGIIGLPLVGKTTIFELLTESNDKSGSNKANLGVAKIPDDRITYLSDLYKPKKTTYAQIEVVDIPGLIPGVKSAAIFLDAIRKADALLHVVRFFDDPSIPLSTAEINPLKDIELINYELLLADLDMIEKRIERIESSKKKTGLEAELNLLVKLKTTLENEQPISSIALSDNESELMKTYQFLTDKPMMICLNVAEADINLTDEHTVSISNYCDQLKLPMTILSANIEREIAQLEAEEKQLFMHELGIQMPGIVKISRSMYQKLGLISFFTVGEDEVKAWTVEAGAIAKKAAGKIHSDIERGFIRAEVVEYAQLHTLGNMNAVKEKGHFRLEGREYIIKDGDIVHFRFNV